MFKVIRKVEFVMLVANPTVCKLNSDEKALLPTCLYRYK
jgi:hypothetical protein